MSAVVCYDRVVYKTIIDYFHHEYSCTSLIPVILLILCKAFVSAWKSFVLKIRKSLLSSAIYSKPQSFLDSKMSHIHSSHSSIGSSVGFNSVLKSFFHFSPSIKHALKIL